MGPPIKMAGRRAKQIKPKSGEHACTKREPSKSKQTKYASNNQTKQSKESKQTIKIANCKAEL